MLYSRSICPILLLLTISCLARASAPAAIGDPAVPRTVEMTVDANRDVRPISPWIYGINGLYEATETPGRKPACAVVRLGGNRTIAWNWVNNASNAGADCHHPFVGGVHSPNGSYKSSSPVRIHQS